MKVEKYTCPKCGCEGECPEEKVLDEDVCTTCGFVFIPDPLPKKNRGGCFNWLILVLIFLFPLTLSVLLLIVIATLLQQAK